MTRLFGEWTSCILRPNVLRSLVTFPLGSHHNQVPGGRQRVRIPNGLYTWCCPDRVGHVQQDVASWQNLAEGARRSDGEERQKPDPRQPRRGWQKLRHTPSIRNPSAKICGSLGRSGNAPSQKPERTTPMVSLPTSRLNQCDAQPFRWLLLCHPLVASTTGQLVRQQLFSAVRAGAAARICREAGARVPSNVTVRDLDHVPSRH